MIRPLTCVTVLLACGSGLYLYQTKHQAQVVDRQIERTVKAIAATKMQTRELAAAWTVLGSPDRLQQLASQYLNITPVMPSQFVAMADLDSRLPAPRALPPPAADALSDTAGGDTPVGDTPVGDTPAGNTPAGNTPAGAPANVGADTTPIATAEPAASPATVPDATPGTAAAAQVAAPPSQAVQPAKIASAKITPMRPDPNRPDPNRAESNKPGPNRTEPVKLAVVARPADRKPIEPPRPVHDVAQAHPAPQYPTSKSPMVAELVRSAPSAPPRLAPASMTGSVLGMAHSTVAAPMPMPAAPLPFKLNDNGN